MPNKKPLIKIDNLSKKFKKIYANKNISFDIYEGDRIAIFGANGAGKTTLVEQLIGVSKPTSGKIEYLFDYQSTPQEKIGMQFQDSSYPDGLSVKDVIEFSTDIYSSNMDKKEFDHIIDIFQMEDFMKKPVKSISGGQQQKLNVLLALIHKPDIVILDEISTGLDIAAKADIFEFVEEYMKPDNRTSIIISHNLDEIEKFADRMVVLKAGELIEDTTVKNIKKEYGSLNHYLDVVVKGDSNDKNKKTKSN